MKLLFKTFLPLSYTEIKDGFNRSLFERLNPWWTSVKVTRFDGCHKGDEVHLGLSLLGLKQNWVSIIIEDHFSKDEWSFVDQGKILPWPLKRWRHHHRILRQGEALSEIIDAIEFECGNLIMNFLMYPMLWMTFAIRPKRYKKYFEGKK
jgi:ligand-binding SRPBCC domain-containing protein